MSVCLQRRVFSGVTEDQEAADKRASLQHCGALCIEQVDRLIWLPVRRRIWNWTLELSKLTFKLKVNAGIEKDWTGERFQTKAMNFFSFFFLCVDRSKVQPREKSAYCESWECFNPAITLIWLFSFPPAVDVFDPAAALSLKTAKNSQTSWWFNRWTHHLRKLLNLPPKINYSPNKTAFSRPIWEFKKLQCALSL